MATTLVTTEIIESQQAQNYFTKADRRVMIGLRATLEMLNIPIPDYAHRGYSGPTPAKVTIAAFNADNPLFGRWYSRTGSPMHTLEPTKIS